MMERKPYTKIYTDKEGRHYFNEYSNITTKAVFSEGNLNTVYEGQPKLVLRLGDSKFGNELIIQLLNIKKITTYKTDCKYDTFEIYLDAKFGLKFIKDFLNSL